MISEKFNLSSFKKFYIFFYTTISIAFILDYYIMQVSFAFFSYTLIFALSLLINDKKIHDLNNIKFWEFLVGAVIMISSFTLVTPIKHLFFPNTRDFGVFNGGIFIIGYFIIFYGIREYRTISPFILFYGTLVTLNGLWGFIINDFAQRSISPISSFLTYSFLKTLGYPVSLNHTTITIITQSGRTISATIAGPCSGIEGMTLSAVMLTGLLIGAPIKYLWRAMFVITGVIIMFFVNILRLLLIFIATYYWGYDGLNLTHEWLGNILFLMFILSYWHIIDKKFIKRRMISVETSLQGEIDESQKAH